MALDNQALEFIDMVTRQTVAAMHNEKVLLGKCNMDYENEFNGEIGDSVRVRRPIYVLSTDGAVISDFDQIQEGTALLEIDRRKKVALKVTRRDFTLSNNEIDIKFSTPAGRELVQKIESDISDQINCEVYNFTGTPGTFPSTFDDISEAETLLTELGTPTSMPRLGAYTARAVSAMASGLQNVFPNPIATRAIERAEVQSYAAVGVHKSNSLKSHFCGVQGGTPVINGAGQEVAYTADQSRNQWSQTLNTSGWTASVANILRKGDVFTIAGVNAVNRMTRESTTRLQDFVVLEDATSDGAGEATLTISPPIMIDDGINSQVTVDAAPAAGAAITVRTGTSNQRHIQNVVWVQDAVACAIVPLRQPLGGVASSTESHEGISVQVVMDFDIKQDENLMRFDVMYGIKIVAPDMIVRHTQ